MRLRSGKKLPEGWEVVTVAEFLGLTPEEEAAVEQRLREEVNGEGAGSGTVRGGGTVGGL